MALAKIRKRQREVFIRQHYELSDCLEYDFGEVSLDCGEGIKTYHMVILSSPGGSFQWLYLYTNQKKAVFMDSPVSFFRDEHAQGYAGSQLLKMSETLIA